MTTLHYILDYIADILIASDEFKATCVSKLGAELLYVIDADETIQGNDFPLLMLHKLPKVEEADDNDEWMIQLILGVMIGEKIEENGRYYRPQIKYAEEIMDDILALFDKNLNTFGVNGCSLRRVSTNTIVARIGDADDVQVVSSIRLEMEKYL
ncbi:MAG: hypothetical protein JRJ85_21865 [Deltaproteobacteria bacterium]|nr:hypothetical protein [Deltaproteobacteria bacterium]